MTMISQRLTVNLFLVLGGLFLVGCTESPQGVSVAQLSESPGQQAEAEVTSDPAQTAKAVVSLEVQSETEAAGVPVAQKPEAPARYTVRKEVSSAKGAAVPPVLLSAGHAKLCLVKVGQAFPSITLPKLGGGQTELTSLYGEQATVILFWHPDRWMARTALIDMQRDVASQFAAEQVAVVGIAVQQPSVAVQAALNQAQALFPQLLDSDGQAFAAVGTQSLPRLYVLDPEGKIVWFDIEYSEGTRRELWQTLGVLTKSK